jgi:hypothetical protein
MDAFLPAVHGELIIKPRAAAGINRDNAIAILICEDQPG